MKFLLIVALVFASLNVVCLQRNGNEQTENDRQWMEHVAHMQKLNQEQHQQQQYRDQMGSFTPIIGAVFGR